MSKPRYPDIYCIGAHRGGSTWLFRSVSAHPGVYSSGRKGAHYFDTVHLPDQRWWHWKYVMSDLASVKRWNHLGTSLPLALPRKDDQWFASLFQGARPDQLCFDSTPNYSRLPAQGIEHLYGLNPEARVIFVMRNPVDRAFSHAKRTAGNRGVDKPSPAYLLERVKDPENQALSSYVEILENWGSVVPQDQLLVASFDDLLREPVQLLTSILAFCGLPPDKKTLKNVGKTINSSFEMEIPAEVYAYLQERYAPDIAELKKRYPAQTKYWTV